MIEINLTLLIQVINFIIAYIILRFLFFRPVVAVIKREDQEKDSLLDTIEQRRIMLQDREKERQELWRQCQYYFIEHAPQMPSRLQMTIAALPEQQLPSLDQKTIEKYSELVTDAIVQKVRHVQ